jgi:hypothetical protein
MSSALVLKGQKPLNFFLCEAGNGTFSSEMFQKSAGSVSLLTNLWNVSNDAKTFTAKNDDQRFWGWGGWGVEQGCQICLGATYENGKNISIELKIYQLAMKYIPNDLKTYQMAVKYTNSFHSKAFRRYPNWDFGIIYVFWYLATLGERPG